MSPPKINNHHITFLRVSTCIVIFFKNIVEILSQMGRYIAEILEKILQVCVVVEQNVT